MMHELVVEIIKSAASIATDFELMGEWEEWHVEREGGVCDTELELQLLKELDQIDKAGMKEKKDRKFSGTDCEEKGQGCQTKVSERTDNFGHVCYHQVQEYFKYKP